MARKNKPLWAGPLAVAFSSVQRTQPLRAAMTSTRGGFCWQLIRFDTLPLVALD